MGFLRRVLRLGNAPEARLPVVLQPLPVWCRGDVFIALTRKASD